jgi:hypothetical protein
MTKVHLAAAVVAALAALAATAPAASAATLCVGAKAGCFPTLQAAVDAANGGDTIRIAPGTFAGGVTIDKSVTLRGAGAGETIIRGGGPVLTIGEFLAATEPTVTISGVTITGGVTQSAGGDDIFAFGGGVEIPPGADFGLGATVTIASSIITGNKVAPSGAAPLGQPCPGGPCPFALAVGGGIDNSGTLTVTNTTISDNLVGSASGLSALASDAYGGAIQSWQGAVTISNSTIAGNRVGASAPNGQFADGGAMFLEGGSLTMSNTSVVDNSASLAAAFPDSVDLLAIAGGIHLSDQVSAATISNSTISRNSASMTNSVGYATAFSGGLHVDLGVQFSLSNSVVSDNSVSARTLPGSSSGASGDSAAGELHGTIADTRITGNTVSVSSVAGDAGAAAGASIFFGSISNSLIRGNSAQASSPNGSATVKAGALLADEGGMTLRATTVTGNGARAQGQSATAMGGGVFDAPIPDGPPGGPLTLVSSSITGNVLAGSGGATLQGGGLYIQSEPLALTNSVIARNVPDQCFGC